MEGKIKMFRNGEAEWEWVTIKNEKYLWRPEDKALYDSENLFPYGYRILTPNGFWVTRQKIPPSIHILSALEQPVYNAPTVAEREAEEKAAKAKYWSDIMKKKKEKEAKLALADITKKIKTIQL
jgi:hypothetical protein